MYKYSTTRFFLMGMLICSTSFLTVVAQPSDFFMEFRGKAIYENVPLQGAKVTVYKNEQVYQNIVTDKKGNISFDLPYNSEYKITFEKKGCVNMHLLINAKVPKGKEKHFYGYETAVPFFKTDEQRFDTKKYNYPFTKILFDATKGMADDKKYLDDFTKGIVKEMLEDEKKALAEKEKIEKAEKEKKTADKNERLKNAKNEAKNRIKISATLSVFNKKSKPLRNKKIELVNTNGEVVEITTTNELGAFVFTLLKSDEKFLVRMSEADPSLPAYSKIIVTNKNGKEVNSTTLDAQGKMKLEFLPADITTLSLMNLDDDNNTLSIRGKLLSGNGNQTPLEGAKVNLINNKGVILKTINTNSSGEFEFTSLLSDQDYLISLDAAGMPGNPENSIVLTDKNGNEVKKIKAAENGKFQFRMLIPDNKTLARMQVEDAELRTELAGQLFSKGANAQTLGNIRVQLLNDKNEIIQTCQTDANGKFTFENLASDYYYVMKIDANDPAFKSLTGIILKDVHGNLVNELEKNGSAFSYELLSNEQSKIGYIYADDPWLKILHPAKTAANKPNQPDKISSLLIKENVYFKAADATLLPEAQKVLDKVIGIMEISPNVAIELSSHTDSKGSDEYNMTLSQTRAQAAVNYIVSNGIPANRITGKGYGETKLVNRCSNGINCSEEEHAQNRRIEFAVKLK